MNNFLLTTKRGLRVAALVATGLNLIAAFHASAAAPTITMVTAFGDTATTTTGTGTYLAFSGVNVNSSGNVAFNASLVATRGGVVNTTNNFGNWTGLNTLDLLTQIGSPTVVGTGTAMTATVTLASYVNVPFYNDNGDVTFEAPLKIVAGQATLQTRDCIWSTSSGSLTLVAREGSAAPGPMGSNFKFQSFTASGLTDSKAVVVGNLALGAGVAATSNQGIWEGTQVSNLALLMRTGDQVTNTVGSVTNTLTIAAPLRYFSTAAIFQGQDRAFAIGGAHDGDFAILTNLTRLGVLSSGIITNLGGTTALLAKLGDPAPDLTGATATGTFTRIATPMINASDDVAFAGTASIGHGITAKNNIAIWEATGGSAGTLAVQYQIGEPVPVFDASTSTTSTLTLLTLSDPLLNDNNALAFVAETRVGNLLKTSLFCDSTGTLTQFAQIGQQAPGCPTGVKFALFKTVALANGGGATGQGELVFRASLSGPGVTVNNDLGIWAVDNTGTLQLVQRSGDIINLGTVGSPINKKIVGVNLTSFTKKSATSSVGVAKGGQIGYSTLFSDLTGAVFTATF